MGFLFDIMTYVVILGIFIAAGLILFLDVVRNYLAYKKTNMKIKNANRKHNDILKH